MALEALTQPIAGDCQLHDDRCVVHGVSAHEIRHHAAQVIELRSRVAQLEHALAKASADSIRSVPLHGDHAVSPATGVSGSRDLSLLPPPPPVPTVVDDDPFEEGWTGENASFEERIAARLFFQEDAVDERSRRWFLDSK